MNLKRRQKLGGENVREVDVLMNSALDDGLHVMAPSIYGAKARVLATRVTQLHACGKNASEIAAGFRVGPIDDHVPRFLDQRGDPARDIAQRLDIRLFAAQNGSDDLLGWKGDDAFDPADAFYGRGEFLASHEMDLEIGIKLLGRSQRHQGLERISEPRKLNDEAANGSIRLAHGYAFRHGPTPCSSINALRNPMSRRSTSMSVAPGSSLTSPWIKLVSVAIVPLSSMTRKTFDALEQVLFSVMRRVHLDNSLDGRVSVGDPAQMELHAAEAVHEMDIDRSGFDVVFHDPGRGRVGLQLIRAFDQVVNRFGIVNVNFQGPCEMIVGGPLFAVIQKTH